MSREARRAEAGTRSMRRYAVPIAFASSTTCALRASKRDRAPEKVNAMIRPSSANTGGLERAYSNT